MANGAWMRPVARLHVGVDVDGVRARRVHLDARAGKLLWSEDDRVHMAAVVDGDAMNVL